MLIYDYFHSFGREIMISGKNLILSAGQIKAMIKLIYIINIYIEYFIITITTRPYLNKRAISK